MNGSERAYLTSRVVVLSISHRVRGAGARGVILKRSIVFRQEGLAVSRRARTSEPSPPAVV